MSQDSIITELLAELESLRKESNLSKSEIIESLSEFGYEELADRLKIRGILISEGTWNGLKYTWSKLKEMYNKFKDKLSNLPIKVEHERLKEYNGKVVGKHTKVRPNEFLKALEYEAEITDPKAIEDVKKGRFRATSLKIETNRIEKNGEELATNLIPHDNSLTAYPACKTCNMFSIQELSEGGWDTSNLTSNELKYFGVRLFKEEREEKGKEGKTMELIELSEGEVLAFPEEEEEGMEEVELEIMPEDLAKKKKRGYIKYPTPGKYPKRVSRRKGYYYYPYGYPVPYYYWYYYPYGYYSEIDLDELIDCLGEYETVLAEEKFKIVRNKKTGKYVLFKKTGKEGFGAWKIVGQFDSEAEARKAASKLAETPEKAYKCPQGQKWSDEEGKCVPIEGEYPGKEEKEGESMSEELAGKKIVCPVCGKEDFKTFKEFKEHWSEKHEGKYGPYKAAKKLAEAILKDKDFRKAMRKHLAELSEEKKEGEGASRGEGEKEQSKEGGEEEKKESEGEVEKEEAKEAEEKKEEAKEEEKKEEEKKEEEEVKKPLTKKEVYEAIKKEVEKITPEVAAELLLAREVKEEEF